jgi:hypothetical protein
MCKGDINGDIALEEDTDVHLLRCDVRGEPVNNICSPEWTFGAANVCRILAPGVRGQGRSPRCGTILPSAPAFARPHGSDNSKQIQNVSPWQECLEHTLRADLDLALTYRVSIDGQSSSGRMDWTARTRTTRCRRRLHRPRRDPVRRHGSRSAGSVRPLGHLAARKPSHHRHEYGRRACRDI